ncbi:MAG TPA: DUF5675 family protein [Flavisolibacter sp.]|jgi:hypothetical protein|nr:DUF5675 family protein [Flavisolibacter sp.]
MELQLFREYLKEGTHGELFYKDLFICYTVERPWLLQDPSGSCVKEGHYRLTYCHDQRNREHFQLMDTPGKRIYRINSIRKFGKSLVSCIAPALWFTAPGQGAYSLHAKNAILKLLDETEGADDLWLQILPASKRNGIQVKESNEIKESLNRYI